MFLRTWGNHRATNEDIRDAEKNGEKSVLNAPPIVDLRNRRLQQRRRRVQMLWGHLVLVAHSTHGFKC
jgi:hypothetical protein